MSLNNSAFWQTTQEPSGQLANYEIRRLGQPMMIYNGVYLLQQQSKSVRVRGRLDVLWLPTPTIRFYGRAGRTETHRLELDHGRIEIPSLQLASPVLILGRTGLTAAGMQYRGIINGRSIAGVPDGATKIEFHLTNFHLGIFGERVRFGRLHTRSRISLRARGWRITIDEQSDRNEREENLRNRGGYSITHAGALARANNGPISLAAAERESTKLHYFFAFCRGFWCGPMLTAGKHIDTVIWAEWMNWRLTPWRDIQSWFPTLKPTEISALYGNFSGKWQIPLWRNTLRRVLGWYVQANAYGDTLEARIIPAFVALETLAWVYIVEDQRLVTAAAFDDRRTMNAALRISRLLQELQIPSRIPAEHRALCRAARTRQAADGPHMIAKVRNDLVHPKQKGALDKKVLFQSTSLSLEYLELALLAIFRYQGSYVRRITEGSLAEATVDVPWT